MAEETVNVNPDGSTTFEGSAAGGEESTMPPVEDPMVDEETIQEVAKGTDPAIYLLLTVVLIGFLYFMYTRKVRADAEDEFFVSLEEEKVSACGGNANENDPRLLLRFSSSSGIRRTLLLHFNFSIHLLTKLRCSTHHSSTSSFHPRSMNIMPSKRSA